LFDFTCKYYFLHQCSLYVAVKSLMQICKRTSLRTWELKFK
jgi:hypothetical protein